MNSKSTIHVLLFSNCQYGVLCLHNKCVPSYPASDGRSIRLAELSQISITLPSDLVRELRQRCEYEEATMSAIVESALIMFLEDLPNNGLESK